MPDTKLKPGMYQLPAACWTVLTAAGEGAGYEGSCSHYATEAEAAKALPDYQNEENTRVLVVTQESGACWIAVAACGTVYTYEGDYDEQHFGSKVNLLDSLESPFSEGWERLPDNTVLCDQNTCSTCHPGTDPLNVPVPQVAGQLPLPEVGHA